MKFLLKQFAERDTGWIYKDFTKARTKLILIYLLIVAFVIVLFSFLLIWQLEDEFSSNSISSDKSEIIITEDKAIEIAKEVYPNLEITDTEYEIEDKTLYFTIEFEDERDVKVDLFSGEKKVINEEDENIITLLTDDFEEIVVWIAQLVFILAGLGSVFVANKTLVPVKRGIEKQKRFVSDAAHELRNPLAAIHSSLEAELRQSDNKVLENILFETKKLINISEDLLDLEKVESNKSNKLFETDISDIVESVLSRLKKSIEEKKLDLNVDIEKSFVDIEESDLEKIIYNLVHNAIKFTGENGKINISYRDNVLEVSDTGIGIKEENIEKIFDRFYQEDSSRDTNKEGSGLGLSLVQEIVNSYGGTINVRSDLGEGSTFKIIF
jgi:signal transduction histidine kinase